MFTASQQDPYVRSHPMARTRIANLRRIAGNSPYFGKSDSPSLQLRHDLMRAKLAGFINRNRPQATFNRYPASDNTLPAKYARAIASYFRGGLRSFLPKIEALIRKRPNNPYFHELKGELLLKSGKSRAAVGAFQTALKLRKGKGSLIKTQLAQAMLNTNSKSYANQAIRLLRRSIVDERTGIAFRSLARAYAAKGDIAAANLATAEGYFYEGRVKQAQNFAKRAQPKFKRGTAQWVKANDIINYRKTGG